MKVPTLTLVKLNDFTFTEDFSWHRRLTCVRHPERRWFTKNPYARNLHYSATPENPTECECPWEDLRVVVEESQPPTN